MRESKKSEVGAFKAPPPPDRIGLNGVYMGALSYADDITLIAPSIGGLNEML